jgi:hypothetical protein
MTLSDTLYTVCAGNAALVALVGDRIYRARHEVSGYPQIVYSAPITTDNTLYRTHGEAPGRSVIVAQFDCYGATANQADAVADALSALWDGYQSASADIGYAFVNNRIDDGYSATLESFRVVVDIRIEIGV